MPTGTVQMESKSISTIFNEQDCEEVLRQFDKTKTLLSYKITKYNEQVLGFLAEHYLLTITCSEGNGSSSVCSQQFFLKSLPLHNNNQKAYVENMGVFRKEILMYKNLLRYFFTGTDKRIGPKYYYSKSDQVIVIEDLSAHNYQVIGTEYLNFEKCKGALDTIATFHAASIIFEESKATGGKPFRINEHFKQEVSEATFSFEEGHVREMWCKSATRCLGDLIRFFTNDCRVAERIKEYVYSNDGLRKYLGPSEKYRNVVCHDDLWRNNLMFNVNNECMLVDFQLTRYTPPAFDMLLLLYINVERDYLNEHFKSFLNLYYESFKNELSKNNMDVEQILPVADFLASVGDYTLPALVESCLYGTNVYLSKEMSARVTSSTEIFEEFSFKNRSPFVIEEFERNDEFRDRISNVLRPLVEIFEAMS